MRALGPRYFACGILLVTVYKSHNQPSTPSTGRLADMVGSHFVISLIERFSALRGSENPGHPSEARKRTGGGGELWVMRRGRASRVLP